MFTAVALVIVVVAATLVVVAAKRLPSVWRPLRSAGTALSRALQGGARFASRAADGLLARHNGEVVAARVVLFTVVAALPLAAALTIGLVPALSVHVDPGALLAAGLAFLLLLLLAAAFIVREDYDVMDGLVAERNRRFAGARAAAHPAAVAIAIVLVVAYLAAAAWWLMALHGLPLVAGTPATGPAPLTYLLIALRALPTDPLLSLLDRVVGDDTRAVAGSQFVAGAYFVVARVIGAAIVLGFVIVAIEHRRQARRFLAEIEASATFQPELLARGRRAPSAIRRALLAAATTANRDNERQRRFIAAAVEVGLLEFPAQFCASLPQFSPEIQGIGLDRAIEMFRYRTREFDVERASALFAAAAPVFAAGTLELEPAKKLVRLMASVVIFKKESLTIPASVKATVMEALKVELAEPRAKEDAALRGILRDLQAALGGEPILIRPILPSERGRPEWVKPAPLVLADLAAQPETPSTTVH